MQEGTVVDAPLSVIIAVIAIFDAAKIASEARPLGKLVIAHHAVLAPVHEDGVVAPSLQVLAERIEVLFGISRTGEIVFHQWGDAGQDGRQDFQTLSAI